MDWFQQKATGKCGVYQKSGFSWVFFAHSGIDRVIVINCIKMLLKEHIWRAPSYCIAMKSRLPNSSSRSAKALVLKVKRKWGMAPRHCHLYSRDYDEISWYDWYHHDIIIILWSWYDWYDHYIILMKQWLWGTIFGQTHMAMRSLSWWAPVSLSARTFSPANSAPKARHNCPYTTL